MGSRVPPNPNNFKMLHFLGPGFPLSPPPCFSESIENFSAENGVIPHRWHQPEPTRHLNGLKFRPKQRQGLLKPADQPRGISFFPVTVLGPSDESLSLNAVRTYPLHPHCQAPGPRHLRHRLGLLTPTAAPLMAKVIFSLQMG